jgi:hypothetical protein
VTLTPGEDWDYAAAQVERGDYTFAGLLLSPSGELLISAIIISKRRGYGGLVSAKRNMVNKGFAQSEDGSLGKIGIAISGELYLLATRVKGTDGQWLSEENPLRPLFMSEKEKRWIEKVSRNSAEKSKAQKARSEHKNAAGTRRIMSVAGVMVRECDMPPAMRTWEATAPWDAATRRLKVKWRERYEVSDEMRARHAL